MSLNELAQVCGVSGYEKEVRALIRRLAEPYADGMQEDALGNLLVTKRGTGANPQTIMLAAHMDEIGLQVTKIEDSGMVRVKMLGSVWIPTAYQSRVTFRNGTAGIVASSVRLEDVKTDFTKLYVDIGATSREDARKYVDIGDVACFDGAYREFANSIVSVKALDDRIGCHILLETLKALKQTTDHVVFAFTVQEEVGCRGSRVAAERVQPDIGVSVDVTPAHDRPGDLEGSNALGEGVAIKISDTSVICDEDLVGEFIGLCMEKDIPFQKEVLYVGGTDASSMNLSNQGVRAAGISVVTRYTHGPNAMVHMGDVAAAIALLTAWLGK